MGATVWPVLRLMGGLLLLLGLAACGDEEKDRLKTPIPRLLLFGEPLPRALQISPDGAYVSYIADYEDAPNIWVSPVAAPGQSRPVTGAAMPGIGAYDWSDDGTALVYLAPVPESGNWHLFRTRLADGGTRDLTPVNGVHARLIARSDAHPGNVFVSLSQSEAVAGDIYRIDTGTGARLLVMEGGEAGAYLAGPDLSPLVRQTYEAGGFRWSVRAADGAWRAVGQVPPDDALGTVLDHFAADGTDAFLRDSRGAETLGLVRLSLAEGAAEVLARDTDADIARAVFDPISGLPVAYAVEDGRRRWTALTAQAASALEKLALMGPGDLDILDQTPDGRLWLVSLDASIMPPQHFLYDHGSGTARPVDLGRALWADLPTVSQSTHSILNRDGTKLMAYLSLPPERRVDAAGKPDKPSPLVLAVHGGPWDRDRFGFSPLHQWLATRGYAVLSVNYRGSTGFGKRFRAAADQAWGTHVPDDLVDAARWAVQQGIARKGAAGLFGGAFGGYAALMALARGSEDFACAVSLAGPADLAETVTAIPPSAPVVHHLFRTRIGDPATAEGRASLAAQSPLHQAASIEGAVLLAGGGLDPLAPLASMTALAGKLSARQIDVVELHFPDEGHGLARAVNEQAFFAAAEAFFGHCLGGRVEAATPDLAQSSLRIARGGALLPALAQALADAARPDSAGR